MKKTIGILAHVDAGKTTFSEQVLLHSHVLRTAGRVDHQNAFLDFHPMERERGITIFSEQACIAHGDDTIYWVDTPGHSDFTAEMERALSILDAAVLVVSSSEGIEGHTELLWQLLAAQNIPTILLLNKIDLPSADPQRVIGELTHAFSSDVVDFRQAQKSDRLDSELCEEVLLRDEELMEAPGISDEMYAAALSREFMNREIFPVFAVSALQDEGVGEAMEWIFRLPRTQYGNRLQEEAGGIVYRVRHEDQRITLIKLLSGTLHVKDIFPGSEQKINEIRCYQGAKYQSVQTAEAGDLIGIPGLTGFLPGDAFGNAERRLKMSPTAIAADVLWDTAAIPAFKMVAMLREMEEESPEMAVRTLREHVTVHVMGRIQLEVMQERFRERFGAEISFGSPYVLYKETIAAPVVGIGHYEPLRHYAEVHLRLVPAERGSGIHFVSRTSVNDLALNWQRLIETHVFEKEHKGVLTGSPLTDVTVELIAGRAHLKHTEGGDFRQAVYRAIRQGLMQADSVLLEPIVRFEVTVPEAAMGKISASLSRIQAETEGPEIQGDKVRLNGLARLSAFMQWQDQFMQLTHGRGSVRYAVHHYAPAADAEKRIAEADYNPLADDTPDSVFCSHGAGYTVPWNEVALHAHLHPELDS